VKLDAKRIAARTVAMSIKSWPRIFTAKHAQTPIGSGYGSSRFSSTSAAFRVLYAAENFSTAFAEAVVRDRFEEKQRRYLYRKSLEALVATEIHSRFPLALVDLTSGGAYELGVDTDARGARSHKKGQDFAETLHQMSSADGVLFPSRLTGGLCVAVYDRAFWKLAAVQSVDLVQLAALSDEIKRLGIVVRRSRCIP
jgi:RES domain-containing protein